MPEVPVNGKVLKWAREIRGLGIDNAAGLLNISPEELRAYESGKTRPLVGLLRLMSARYKINFTSLLMPEPLPIEKPPTDYRVHPQGQPLSIDTIVAREEVIEALEAFEDINIETTRIVPTLNIGKAALGEDPEAVAARERKRFGVSVEEQRTWRGTDSARREWRQRVEDRGIFTYMIPMPPQELRGFSELRNDLAAICINDREPTEGAKIFTLFHEYCHLLLRQTGISDENNSNHVERFCNQFAASFLIPLKSLKEVVGNIDIPYEFSDEEVKRFAVSFRVSNAAMALRLEKTSLAPEGFYERHTTPWDVPREQRPVRPENASLTVPIRLKRIGHLHAKTVLRATKRRVINSFDASELIGLRPTTFPKLEVLLK